ncbi:MAG TPA: DUF559 domain-containing protein [Bacteroidota bacterium]|nr:DUF559 domain-containing protein [Bacteroidota bacterium]
MKNKYAALSQLAKQLCRELRARETPAEKKYWTIVRNRTFENKKINRQFPIFFDYNGKQKFYIADFHCFEYKIIVELDGTIHDYQKDRDELRDYIISALGYRVIRVRNEEIENNVERTLSTIKSILKDREKTTCSPLS